MSKSRTFFSWSIIMVIQCRVMYLVILHLYLAIL